MTRSYPEWAYLVDESGRYWCHIKSGERQAVDGSEDVRPPQRALYGIPTNDLVSHPHWISSKDDEIIGQVVAVENEKLGVKQEAGPGRISDWKPVEINGAKTLVQSVSIPWDFEGLIKGPTEFTDFIPQYSLYVPAENAVTLWREQSGWVAGYSRGKRWAHVQPLGEISPESIAGELELTLMELSAKGIIEEIDSVVVWGEEDPALRASLETPGGIPVHFLPRPAPTPGAAPDWEFEPHEVSLERQKKANRRRLILGTILGVFAMLLLTAAAFFHIKLLEAEAARLEAKIAANADERDAILQADAAWTALGPAVEPHLHPLELFHGVSKLLPEEGFRLVEFEFRDFQTLLVKGEGANHTKALAIRGLLERSEELSYFEWSIRDPEQRDGLYYLSPIGTLPTLPPEIE